MSVWGVGLKRFDVPLLFVEKPTWPALLDPPSLQYTPFAYEPAPGRNPQPLLKDRFILKPGIDLNSYRCRAVIDWIEIQLDTAGVHQARNVQSAAARILSDVGSASSVFVTGLDRRPGHTGSHFILRIQQPQPQVLLAFCKKIVAKYDPDRKSVQDMPVTGVEVSVDFYVKNNYALSEEAQNLLRWQMTEVLQRHLKPGRALTEREGNHPRFFAEINRKASSRPTVGRMSTKATSKQRVEIVRLGLHEDALTPLRIGAHSQAPIDTTYYIGKKSSAVMLRVMDKITDQRDSATNTAVRLSPADCRSRIEVTFLKDAGEVGGPAAVGIETLADLFGYTFKPTRKLVFEFFYPTVSISDDVSDLPFPVNITELEVFKRSGVYGLDRVHRSIAEIRVGQYLKREVSQRPRRIGTKGKTVSFIDLNRMVDRALVSLSKAWKLERSHLLAA